MLTAIPAHAQTPSPSPIGSNTVAKTSAPWTFYMAIATVGIAALTLLMAIAGYMVQAPGFRRAGGSGPGAKSTPPASS